MAWQQIDSDGENDAFYTMIEIDDSIDVQAVERRYEERAGVWGRDDEDFSAFSLDDVGPDDEYEDEDEDDTEHDWQNELDDFDEPDDEWLGISDSDFIDH